MYKDDLYILCLKYCRNKQEAQDNLQDAFLDIFLKIKNYNATGSFEGWIKRITINKAIDKYKNKREFNIVIKNDLLEHSVSLSEHLLTFEEIYSLTEEKPLDQKRQIKDQDPIAEENAPTIA